MASLQAVPVQGSDAMADLEHQYEMPVLKFVHSPLQDPESSIRLLRMLAIEDNQVLFSLTHFPLKAAPRYKALSYTWGPEWPCRSIWIGECILTVRQNLYDFLLVHGESQGHYLWADQICIDQSSVLERNHQVSLMAEIYSSADEVIIWLGEAHPIQAELLLPFFDGPKSVDRVREKYYDKVTETFYTTPSTGTSVQVKYDTGGSSVEDVNESHLVLFKWETLHRNIERSGDVETAFNFFFSNPYWSRLWIVQEIMLARNITITWGKHTIPWSHFSKFDEAYSSKAYDDLIPAHLYRRIRYLIKYKPEEPIGSMEELSTIIPVFCRAECSDLRDKVYGLLAMTRQRPGYEIEIDYGKSPEEVFLDAVRVIAYERRSYLWESTGINACFDLAEEMMPDKVSRSKIFNNRVLDNATEQLDALLEWLDYKLGHYEELGLTAGEYLVDKFGRKLV